MIDLATRMVVGWHPPTAITSGRSLCSKPVVGGESCQAAHLGYVVSGRIHIASTDGTELDLGPGHAYRLYPGHDAWVLGDEAFVALEFESKTAETYAKG